MNVRYTTPEAAAAAFSVVGQPLAVDLLCFELEERPMALCYTVGCLYLFLIHSVIIYAAGCNHSVFKQTSSKLRVFIYV